MLSCCAMEPIRFLHGARLAGASILLGAWPALAQECLPVRVGEAENWRPTQWSYKARLVAWRSRRLGLARPDHEPRRGRLQKDVVYSSELGLGLDAWVPPGRGPFPGVI